VGLVLISASIYYLTQNWGGDHWILPFLLIGISFMIVVVALNSRMAALKAQDRAIRAEENLRYFMLVGKRMDPKVNMRQIIALRFASDEELEELTEKVVQENLRAKEIKALIKNWRVDRYRL